MPVTFSLQGLVVFTVFRCVVRRVPADFLTFTKGESTVHGRGSSSLTFDNILRADEGFGFSLLGRIAEIVRVKYML